MSTVQLQKALGVDRYNLYHHLKKLASLELIENHRDEGRARWWRKNLHVDLPELLHATAAPNAPAEVLSTTEPRATLASLAVDEEGREVIVLDLKDHEIRSAQSNSLPVFRMNLDCPSTFRGTSSRSNWCFTRKRSDTVSEALSVESKVAPPPLSCPKCGGLLPSGLGEINCTLCDARVRVDHAATRRKWSRRNSLARPAQRCSLRVLTTVLPI